MDELSDELLCLILSYLDPWTLSTTVQYVSKRLRRLSLENKLWYQFTEGPHQRSSGNLRCEHWSEIDWYNEWKWRKAPLRINWVDESVTVLTFTLQSSDIVALLDDGSLRRWRRCESGWQEISRTESTVGRESFRFQQTSHVGNRRLYATAQLGYNDAIATNEHSVYFGAGQVLQQLDVTTGTVTKLYEFGVPNGGTGHNLITTVRQLNSSTLIFGSFPAGLHLLDLRDPSGVVNSADLPKAPSALQATPLCIRKTISLHDFVVCGRFPSVLLYDLRCGLTACSSIWSGADSLSSMTIASNDRVIAGGSYRGRGTLECFNMRTLKLESKNRWTASSATILGIAGRNCGLFAAGGSGNLRLLDGIDDGIRDIDLNCMVTKIEIDSNGSEYRNAAERVYLGCGADGLACVDFGRDDNNDSEIEEQATIASSLLRGQYSDMHFLGRFSR